MVRSGTLKLRRRLLAAAAAIGLLGGGVEALIAGAPAAAQSGRDDSLLDGQEEVSCREAGRQSRRIQIAGGQDARVEDFPFIVQVQVGRGRCGGSIFAPGFVLTAAHCVMPIPGSRDCIVDGKGKCELADPGDIKVFRANAAGQALGETAGVTHVRAHPKFRYPTAGDAGSLDADIAILRLDRKLEVSDGDYVNIADPRFDASYAKGGECARVAGWGRTDVVSTRNRIITRGKQTDKLQALNLELQPHERCRARYPDFVTENMLCAGDGIEGFNTCKGDSGGPLIVDVGRPVQVGVVSWAFGCAQGEHYTVFARVGAPEVRGWINETMGVR